MYEIATNVITKFAKLFLKLENQKHISVFNDVNLPFFIKKIQIN